MEQVADAVKGVDVGLAQRRAQHAEQQKQDQFAGVLEAEQGGRQQRLPAGYGPEQGVGDDRGDDAGDQPLVFELGVLIEDLDGEQGPAQRRAERGADAPGHAGQQQDAAVGRREVEPRGEKRAEAGADLGDGALASGRAAGADSGDGGHRLDQRHPPADVPPLVVEGVDGRIGAVPLGLGGELEHQEAADQTADDRDQKEKPAVAHEQGVDHPLAELGHAPGAFLRRVIAGKLAEKQGLGGIGGEVEGDRSQARHQADQGAENQRSAEGPDVHPAQGGGQIFNPAHRHALRVGSRSEIETT